jgi:cytochrome b|uniref:Uncharacterized protein n=1 Tax=Mus musculus TaxID=10090 RepID=Q3V3T4_MOUSE|nr:unnamed protein product [Mus musculus]
MVPADFQTNLPWVAQPSLFSVSVGPERHLQSGHKSPNEVVIKTIDWGIVTYQIAKLWQFLSSFTFVFSLFWVCVCDRDNHRNAHIPLKTAAVSSVLFCFVLFFSVGNLKLTVSGGEHS